MEYNRKFKCRFMFGIQNICVIVCNRVYFIVFKVILVERYYFSSFKKEKNDFN